MASRVKVEDLGLRKMLKRIKDMDGWGVSVGVHEDDSHRGDGIDNATLYAIHEFGAGRVPERASLRTAFDSGLEGYVRLLARGASMVASGVTSPRAAVALVGEKSTADTVEAIRAGIPPPLAASTVARKGSSTPLIDTGQLVQAIKPKTGRHIK